MVTICLFLIFFIKAYTSWEWGLYFIHLCSLQWQVFGYNKYSVGFFCINKYVHGFLEEPRMAGVPYVWKKFYRRWMLSILYQDKDKIRTLEKAWVGYCLRVKSRFSNGRMIIGFCLVDHNRILRNNGKIWVLILILPLMWIHLLTNCPVVLHNPTFFLCTNWRNPIIYKVLHKRMVFGGCIEKLLTLGF